MPPHIKQVIVVRIDLNMRKGKMAAQAAHASMKVFFDRALDRPQPVSIGDVDGSLLPTTLTVPLDPAMTHWVWGTFKKVVLGVATEADLLRVHELAKERGLPTALIQDLGHTEFHGVPTNTAVAVGPAESSLIDEITGPAGLVETKLL